MNVPDDGESFCQIVVAVSGRRNLRRVHVKVPFECAYTYPDCPHIPRRSWIRRLAYPGKSHSKTQLPVHKVQLGRRNMCPCRDSLKTKIHIGGQWT